MVVLSETTIDDGDASTARRRALQAARGKSSAPTRKRKSAEPPPPSDEVISISPIQTVRVLVPIVGETPLIMHAWSAKAKQQMLDATQNKRAQRQPKDPAQDFRDSMYRTRDGAYGMPSLGFKAAIVAGARFFRGATMTQLRQALYIYGVPSNQRTGSILLTKLESEDPIMREDCVRVGAGGTDLRYRPEFPEWRAVLDLKFVSSILSMDSVLSLIDAGGQWVGIGEWRPERSGANGTFKIDDNREVEIVNGGK